jgi:serine kinase of HPr protein (carbohydrate metabolism regulator)
VTPETAGPSIHASAVLVGARAVLIVGPSGSGKSELAFRLIEAGQTGLLPFTRLVADDRTLLEACHRRLVARPAPTLGGLLEVRGLGIRRLAYEEAAVVGLILDFAGDPAARLPRESERSTEILGISIPRIAVLSVDAALERLQSWRLTEAFRVD